jgi:hypothetical protein
MEMKLDVNDEWVDGLMVARLKSDFETVDNDMFEDAEELKKAIVTLMSLYMTYDDYFKWREEAQVPDGYTGTWDVYRQEQMNKGE